MNEPFEKFIPQSKIEDYGSDFANFDCHFIYYSDLQDAKDSNYDESRHTRINVWFISDPDMGQMIPKVLKPEDLENTFALIMPDLEQPWDVMLQCEKWIQVLKDAVYSMTP